MSRKDRCQKGKSCGSSCISRLKVCRVEVGSKLSGDSSKARDLIKSSPPFEGIKDSSLYPKPKPPIYSVPKGTTMGDILNPKKPSGTAERSLTIPKKPEAPSPANTAESKPLKRTKDTPIDSKELKERLDNLNPDRKPPSSSKPKPTRPTSYLNPSSFYPSRQDQASFEADQKLIDKRTKELAKEFKDQNGRWPNKKGERGKLEDQASKEVRQDKLKKKEESDKQARARSEALVRQNLEQKLQQKKGELKDEFERKNGRPPSKAEEKALEVRAKRKLKEDAEVRAWRGARSQFIPGQLGGRKAQTILPTVEEARLGVLRQKLEKSLEKMPDGPKKKRAMEKMADLVLKQGGSRYRGAEETKAWMSGIAAKGHAKAVYEETNSKVQDFIKKNGRNPSTREYVKIREDAIDRADKNVPAAYRPKRTRMDDFLRED